jgi:hypothetical protein
MTTTTIVFAHGDVLKTVLRHLPIWSAFSDKLILVSPNNCPCIIEGLDCFTYSGRQHFGRMSLERQLFAFKVAMFYNSSHYVFLEYDAVLLQKPKPRKVVQGNLFNSQVLLNKDTRSMSENECFIHFPWIFPRDKLKKFVDEVSIEPTEAMAQDVWLAKKLMELDFEVFNLLGLEGYSKNTIHPKHISELTNCIRLGAYAIHGIKSKETLKATMVALASKDIY